MRPRTWPRGRPRILRHRAGRRPAQQTTRQVRGFIYRKAALELSTVGAFAFDFGGSLSRRR